MFKNIKKSLSCFLAAVLLCSALSVIFTVGVSAASVTGVYEGIDPSTLLSVIDSLEDDFNLPTVGWTVSEGSCEASDSFPLKPYSSYEGSRSLMARVNGYTAGKKITLSRTASVLAESSSYRYIAAAVYLPDEAGGASVTMKLTCARGSISDTKTVDAGKWQIVFFDTKGASKGRIKSISLTFSAEDSCDLYVLLDTVGGCKEQNDVNSARYLSAQFALNGCTADYGKNLTLSLSGEGQYIEAASAVETSFANGNVLRLNMINHSSCRSITLRYKSAGSELYDGEITADIPDTDRTVSCIFKIKSEIISSFMLCFNGAPSGDVEIISIGASPYLEGYGGIGKIDECRIARDKKNISIKGTVNSEAAELLDENEVMLYSLMPYESNAEITAQRSPLATAAVKNGEFSFALPLDSAGDGIYKKYIVASYIDGVLVPICEGAYINNPEILAAERTSLPESKKGIRPLSGNYILDGIAQTAIEISAEKLMTLSSENSISHTVGDRSYYFSADTVAALDKQMKEYSREGIKVRFILTLGDGGDLALNSLLRHPESEGDGEYAFNTESRDGINALRALTDLLVTRYGSSDGVTDNLFGIVLGKSVNDAYNSYNMGYASLSEFALSYSAALRTVYNTALSITSGFEVSVPLGGDWYSAVVSSQRGSFDARSALEAISECITAGGDINWRLAYDITPEEGSYAMNEKAPHFGADAEKITAANLETLTEFFNLPAFHFNGASRTILLLGNEERAAKDENDLISLSADYIYTFLRISGRAMKSVNGYIPSHEAGYNDALRYVGTDKFTEKTSFASELIGKARFDLLVSEGVISERAYYEGSASSVVPSSIKGESVIFDFSKKNALTPSVNCHSVESGVAYGGKDNWGRVVLSSAESDALRGFMLVSRYPLDLSVAPYISFKVRCSSLPEGVETLRVTVAVFSKNNVAAMDTVISVEGESTVVCDLGEFSHLKTCDRIGIYIKGENGEDIGEPMLLVSSVKALSETMSGDKLDSAINVLSDSSDSVSLYTVIAVSAVGISALMFLGIRIFVRKKRSAEISGDNE